MTKKCLIGSVFRFVPETDADRWLLSTHATRSIPNGRQCRLSPLDGNGGGIHFLAQTPNGLRQIEVYVVDVIDVNGSHLDVVLASPDDNGDHQKLSDVLHEWRMKLMTPEERAAHTNIDWA